MPPKSLKLQNLIPKYLNYMAFVKSSSPLTLKAYELDLEQAFGPQGGPTRQKGLSEADLIELSREALNGWAQLSLSSRNRKSATLKSFFNWAYQEELTERNLSAQIISPKVPKKLPHFLSVDEALAVLHSYNKHTSLAELRDKALFLILYGGGLRVSEACALKWIDVHFSTRSLKLVGKGNKERMVILPTLTIQVLQKLRKESESDEKFIFGPEPLNSRVAYEWVRTRGAKAQLMKPLHPHALRHSFATHLLGSGANLRTLQELLGHESLQATEKYTHLGVDQLARTLETHHPLSMTKNPRKKA